MKDDDIDMSGLSDEERLALADEDVGSIAETEAAARAAESITDDAAPAGDPPDDPPALEPDDEPFAMRLAPPALDGHDEQLSALLDQRKAIREQYRQGDIAAEEKDAREDEINDKIADLRAARQNAQFVENFNQQAAEAEYLRTVNDVKAEILRRDGIDYSKEKALLRDWDYNVKMLASDPANADRPARWYLEEAHRLVKQETEAKAQAFGLRRAPGDAGTPSGDAALRDAVRSRRADPGGRVGSLAALPSAAADTGHAGSEFAHLDRLSGDDLESAVARMSPEQQERWATQ